MTTLESPIVGLTFRGRELGRLRMGQKVPTSNGRSRPEKLETFRLTSTDWRLILAASEKYGGKPERWDDAPNKRQFQVTVEADRIPVRIPDDLNWSQGMEAWTAAKCIRRCNQEAMDTGEPCLCREDMEQGRPALCQPYTRVNFILPELPGWGYWRLESHGWEAARELIPMVVGAARIAPRETYFLRLDPRTKKGEENGKPVTYQFHVPVLDTDRTPAELFARDAERLAIEASDPAPLAPPRATGPESGEGERATSGERRDDPSPGTTSEGLATRTDEAPGQPGRHRGRPSDPTSPEVAARGVGRIATSGDPHASATGPGPTQEPPNAEASTSPASPGDGKAGRGRRRGGQAAPGRETAPTDPPPAEPADEEAAQLAYEQQIASDPGQWTR